MKILLIKEHLKLTRGGAERSTAELADCLTELGHNVTVAAAQVQFDDSIAPAWQMSELDLSGAGGRTARWQAFGNAVQRLRETESFDVTHSMEPVPGADFYQPRGGCLLYGALRHVQSFSNPCVRAVKRAALSLNRGRAHKIAAERRLCKESSTVILALSDYVAQQYRELYQVPQARLLVVPNGIVPDAFISAETHQQAEHLRRVLDRQGHRTLLIFVAENLRLKGLMPLIKAVALAKNGRVGNLLPTCSSNDLDLLRILVVTQEDASAYWRAARRLGVGEQFVFVGPTRQMPQLLAASDGLVLPTYHDACSRVVLEALAAGKPVITTRFNGAADFVKPDYGVLIDSPDDIPALAAALRTLCDPNRQATMCAAIDCDGLVEKVSMRRHARQLAEVYSHL